MEQPKAPIYTARELRDYLVSHLDGELSRFHRMIESTTMDLQETSVYRGYIKQCRSTLKILNELKL